MKKLLLFTAFMVVLGSYTFAQRNSILFLSNEALMDQKKGVDHLDQPMIDILKEKYDVTVAYTPFSAIDFSKYGMVFVGRAVTSGDFTDVAFWSAIDIPIFFVSSWLMRSGNLKFFNTTAIQKVANTKFAGDGTSYLGTVTNVTVLDPADPAFAGLQLTDGKLPWYNGFYDYINVDKATIEANCPAKLLAITVDDPLTPEGNDRVAFARFSPKVETYSGSGNIPAAIRTYLHMGADDNVANPNKNFNYWNQTEASLKVIKNEVAYLLSTSKNFVPTSSKNIENQNHITVSVDRSNKVVLHLNDGDKSAEVKVMITNMAGQIVLSQRYAHQANRLVIDHTMKPGLYLLTATSGNTSSTKKILIK